MKKRKQTALLFGGSSFAANGISERLREAGFDVVEFSRRPSPPGIRHISGDILNAAQGASSELSQCDVIINFALLKDRSTEDNVAFCGELGELTRRLQARALIHISSVISTSLANAVVTEDTPPEKSARNKPFYSALKIETDHAVRKAVDADSLILVRPGFIVGPGLIDPVAGMAKALPGGLVAGLGNPDATVPFIDRDILQEGLVKACLDPRRFVGKTMLFADRQSPSVREYLTFCVESLGIGSRLVFLPNWIWNGALWLASPLLSLKKRRLVNLQKMFRHKLSRRSYDATRTETELGIPFHRPWREILAAGFEGQEVNYRIPVWTGGEAKRSAPFGQGESLLYIGMGRIVRERHLPALRRMGYQGAVEWFDPFAIGEPDGAGLSLKRIASIESSGASRAVIATPVGVRAKVLSALPDSVHEVLFEKPFALGGPQYEALRRGLEGRKGFVIHNYRRKANVLRMLECLRRFHSGRLISSQLHFDSPSVELDGAAWLRRERESRTLVLDYALHFLDLAFLFSQGDPTWSEFEAIRTARGHTGSVFASGSVSNHRSSLFLRQGSRQRRCHLGYQFENYSIAIRFFPESFMVFRGRYGMIDDARAMFCELGGVAGKVGERLGLSCDESHQRVIEGFLDPDGGKAISDLDVNQLAESYQTVFSVSDRVYSGEE